MGVIPAVLPVHTFWIFAMCLFKTDLKIGWLVTSWVLGTLLDQINRISNSSLLSLPPGIVRVLLTTGIVLEETYREAL